MTLPDRSAADRSTPVAPPDAPHGFICFEQSAVHSTGLGWLVEPLDTPCRVSWHRHLVTEEEYQRVVDMAGRHDPTGADHMEEMWVHAERADAAEALLAEIVRAANGILLTYRRWAERGDAADAERLDAWTDLLTRAAVNGGDAGASSVTSGEVGHD